MPKRKQILDEQGDVLVVDRKSDANESDDTNDDVVEVKEVSHTEAERKIRSRKIRSEKQMEATRRLIEFNKSPEQVAKRMALREEKLKKKQEEEQSLKAQVERQQEKLKEIEEKILPRIDENKEVIIVKPKRVYKPRTKKKIQKKSSLEGLTGSREGSTTRKTIILNSDSDSDDDNTPATTDTEAIDSDATDFEDRMTDKIKKKEAKLKVIEEKLKKQIPPNPVDTLRQTMTGPKEAVKEAKKNKYSIF